MRNLFLAILIGFLTFSFLMTEAQAKRFGGGRSFGMSRQTNNVSAFNANRAGATAAATKPANRWLGPLAGLAAGGLLASLFMGHGLGSGILSWLLVGGIALLIWRLIRSRIQPNLQTASQNTPYHFSPQQAATMSAAPINFDETAFLRQAKATFIRLQAAYDNKDMSDIREFTAPEVFAEIQLQIQERGDAVNFTEVVSLDARVEDTAIESDKTIASVLFTGLIREEQGAQPTSIDEVWHFQKTADNSHWMVAGIQQSIH